MQGKRVAISRLNERRDLKGTNRFDARLFLLTRMLVWFICLTPSIAVGLSPGKNVLILNSFTERSVTDVVVAQLKSATRSHIAVPVNFEVEYLESERFESPGYEAGLSESLAGTYSGKLDLVIAISYPALRFALDHRDRIFPGVPIIFCGVATSRLEGRPLWPGVTGVTENIDVRGTVDLALRLHPDTKNVVIVSGTSEFERYWQKVVDDELRLHASRLKPIDLVGFPPAELQRKVASLPPHTIVFFQLIPLESEQPLIGVYDVLAAIAKQFPTYCIFDYCFDRGAVGGSYPDSNEQEVKAGELAARILSGEKPETIPVAHGPTAHASVDWRQLRRWNISEAALPAGTFVLYRQPTFFERYRKYVISGGLLIIVQTLLIIGLLVQRRRRRKTEIRLRESEKRFRVMADTTPSLVWMCGTDGKVTYLNDRLIKFTGRDSKAGLGDIWTAYVHSDDIQNVLKSNSLALIQQKAFSREYRLRRQDGVYRWMLDVAAPRVNEDGSLAGFIGSAVDISDQKLANEALETISGRLIEAQEEERSRIARELHDDICQRIALLSMELGQDNLEFSGSSEPTLARIQEIQDHCIEIANDVQALSHKLHSSKLDYLGVEAAIRSLCRELSQQHNVMVDFTCEDVPNPLPSDISLSLFRVTQEALHNAVKYSGGDRFTVNLLRTEADIQLEIKDEGAGFRPQDSKQNEGLGLVSMKERIHLVKGTFTVESKVNHGTKISARVPFHAGM
jgi:PAS domain S-box-containing protein